MAYNFEDKEKAAAAGAKGKRGKSKLEASKPINNNKHA